jgi:two-component system response regulator
VIAKPVSFLALVKLMKVFTAYWLDAAELPQEAA